MSGAVKILPHYTYDDYVHWEGKWELIDGIPYAMSPAPVPKHQIFATNLSAEFRFALKQYKECKVMQPVDYKVKEDTVFQPDMLIVCKPIDKKYLDFPPSLIAEILSPSTVFIDRHTKFHAYQEQGVPWYLILSPETEETEIYSLENGVYQLIKKAVTFDFTFRLDECEVTINFGEVWK
jgi:Uma2 family endonuclease